MKRVMKLILTLALLVCLLPAVYAQAAEGTCGDNLTWTLTDGTLTVSGSGAMTDWSAVTQVPWYGNLSQIKKVEISSGVTSVGNYAFSGCTSLTELKLPGTLTSLGDDAFRGCTGLTAVTIPGKVQSMGQSVFRDTGLQIAIVSEGVTALGEELFHSCGALKTVQLPKSLMTIGSGAFNGCTGVKTIDIPDAVTAIGNSAFQNCDSLTFVDIPGGVTAISDGAFAECDKLDTVLLPGGVTAIGAEAFSGCTSLTDIDLPDSLTTLGDRAFRDCTALEKMFLPEGITQISPGLFSGCTGLRILELPGKITSIGAEAFSGCIALADIELPDKITAIGSHAFENCDSLTQVDIPSGITAISEGVFANCDKLDTVLLPSGVAAIGLEAFSDCTALADIDLPDGLTTLSDRAFRGCTALERMYIPEGITQISAGLFSGCTSLSILELPDKITTIDTEAFSECGLTYLELPEKLTHIGAYAFSSNPGLKEVVIPASVKELGMGAFRNCDKMDFIIFAGDAPVLGNVWLENYTVDCYYPLGNDTWTADIMQNYGGTPTWIGYREMGQCGDNLWWLMGEDNRLVIFGAGDMFDYYKNAPWLGPYCTEIYSVKIGSRVTSIGSYAFYECRKMISVTIPESVTRIGQGAFNICASLQEVILPSKVEILNDFTFSNCWSLKNLQLSENLKEIGHYALAYCEDLEYLVFPASLERLGDEVFGCMATGNCEKVVTFEGDAPVIHSLAFFMKHPVTCYYPPNNATWTESVLKNYGTETTWIVHGPEGGHPYQTETTAPTCTEGGYTVFTCYCGENYIGDHTDPTGHTRGTYTEEDNVDSTCAKEGSYVKVYTCRICGEEADRETVSIAKKKHTWVTTPAVGATCTEPGLTQGKHCSVCKEVLTAQETVPAKGHKEANDAAVAATCTETGLTEGKHCSVCDAVLTKQEVVPALGHTEVTDAAVAATCTETGLTEGKHCSTCGEVFLLQEILPVLGHSWDAGTVTKEPTETEEGSKIVTCQTCGETKTETVPVLRHTHKYTDVITAPTCTKGGYTTRTCPCGDSYKDSETAALGHTEEIIAAVEPTCTRSGLGEGKRCAVCGMKLKSQSYVFPKGHSWDAGTVTKEPTEKEKGSKTFTCQNCGQTRTASIPALGHTHKHDPKVTEPTCTEKGYTTHTCACGDTYRDNEVAAKGHTEVTDTAVAATCTESGLTEGKHCSVCDEILTKQEAVPATGHSWDAGTVTKEPTEKTEGVKTIRCTACGESKTETIPALGHTHSYTETVTAPTCTEKGYTTHSCACGKSYTDSETAALGHSWKNGSCTACGAEDPNYDPPAEPEQPTEPGETAYISRLAGKDRFNTAFMVADQMKINLGIEKFDTIIVASGINFADALSGSYLAAEKNAPILLSYDAIYNNMAKLYIRENLKPGGTVYILGGESAVPASMERNLDDFEVKRLKGADRFGTNLEILKEAGVGDKPVLVCTGLSFADSLSASATELPILLVWKNLTEDQKAFLSGLNGNDLYVIGGESAVSKKMEAQIAEYGVTERVQGKNRFETSIAIAERFFYKPETVVLAYAWNFPDGLCGGPLAVSMNAPLILTMDKYEVRAAEYVQSQPVRKATILGGEGLISQNAVQKIFSVKE